MAAYVVFLVVLWGGAMGATLLLARFRLSPAEASAWDHLGVRAAALATVTVAMWSLASLADRIAVVPDAGSIAPYLWLAAAAPLLAPPVRSNGAVLVSSERWVYVSMALTAVGGFVLAGVTMTRVVMGGVTLQ